jgi:GDP-L-fucose synthase
MNKDDKVLVAGARGMVGSAVVRELEKKQYKHILQVDKDDIDLLNQAETEAWFREHKPDAVFLAAARVGGILANSTYVADFIYENIMIACHIIKSAQKYGVKKLINLGSSCIYPRLEPTNEPYAIAKIAAIKLCRYFNEQYATDFLSVMPTNLYGPGDNFNPETSHVLPALIRKIHFAKTSGAPNVELWGDGSPRREFLYVEDLARALVHLMENHSHADLGEFVNIGTGRDLTIRELGELIAGVVGFTGGFSFDATKPNGMPQKLLDVSKIRSLGWQPQVSLRDGIALAYRWFLEHQTAGGGHAR